MKKINFLLSLFIFSITSIAQPGTLDFTYGVNGIVFGNNRVAPNSIAIQKDGKTVFGSGGYENSIFGFGLERYNADGSIDISFGKEGFVFTGIGSELISVQIQNDKKIVTAGYHEYQDNFGKHFVEILVIRYNGDGTIDNTFGANGIATANVGIKSYSTCMAIQADGKIVVAGYRRDDENDVQNLFMVRFLTDGSLDESFGNKGMLLEFLSSNVEVNDIAIQPEDGKIILGGMYTASNQGAYFLVRYLPDGRRNQGFGINGEAQIQFGAGSSASILNEIALQIDGKIVATGRTFNPSSSTKMTVVRFKTNGAADSSFGENGIAYIKFGEDKSEGTSVLIQDDEKIIIGGFNYPSNFSYVHFALARLNKSGILDSSFGTDGQTTTIIANSAAVDCGVLQTDGKFILAGTDGSKGVFVLARYNGADLILPITYTKFTAAQSQQYITLNWQTATELNNRYFAVERSSNATNYTSIAQLNSAGTGSVVHDYFYTDKLPLQGNNYYRLKQTDADGKYTYSKTVNIAYLKPGAIQLYPNPAKDKLTVKGLNAAISNTIFVLDVQGKTLLQFTAKAAAYTFSVSSLASGTYMIRVKNDNGIDTEKFVIQ